MAIKLLGTQLNPTTLIRYNQNEKYPILYWGIGSIICEQILSKIIEKYLTIYSIFAHIPDISCISTFCVNAY